MCVPNERTCVCVSGVHSSCGERESASGVVCDATLLRVPGTSPQARDDFSTHPPAESVWKVSPQHTDTHTHTQTDTPQASDDFSTHPPAKWKVSP